MPVDLPVDTEKDEQDEQDRQATIGRAYAVTAPRATEEFRTGERSASGPLPQPLYAPAPNAALGMGRAYAPAPAVPSPVARQMGDFALATGDNPSPAPTALSRLASSPTAPAIDPDYAKTQADLRDKSAITPKYDPNTGQTLDKYKIGPGARIGRAFLDSAKGFLYGGLGGAIAAPLEGAFGNKDAPGYYGKGAVSGQYFKDEAQRKKDVAADTTKIKSFEEQDKTQSENFRDQNAAWRDQYDIAKNQDVNDVRQQNADEKKQHDIETENLRAELNAAKDPEAKAKAEVKARKAIADDLGLTGRERLRYVQYGDKAAMDDVRAQQLELAEERLGLMRDRLALDKEKSARAHTKDRQSFEDHWGKRFEGEAEKPYIAARNAILKQYGADKDASQYGKNKQAIDAALAPYEAKREETKSRLQAEKDQEAEQYGVYNKRPNTPQGRPTAPAARPVQTSGTQPVITQKTKQTVKIGDTVTVANKQYRVVGINPQTGKPRLGAL